MDLWSVLVNVAGGRYIAARLRSAQVFDTPVTMWGPCIVSARDQSHMIHDVTQGSCDVTQEYDDVMERCAH